MIDTPGGYIHALQTGGLDAALRTLYGQVALGAQKERYIRLLKAMQDRFTPAAAVISSPGRTELGGNHTDHNHGQVLAAAVDRDCVAAAAPCGKLEAVIQSTVRPKPIRVNLADLTPRHTEKGHPEALVRGVAAGLVRKGGRIGGVHACVDSTVRPGTGLSSSAAFGLLLGGIFNHLYNRGQTAAVDLARIAKQAENEFFGKPCGLMDQLASALGGIVHIDFKDPEDPLVTAIDFDFRTMPYHLAVVNTGGNHAELTPAYMAITQEMQRAAAAMGHNVLRGLKTEDVLQALPRLRQAVGDRAILRALHFIEENQRVQDMVSALRGNRIDDFLKKVAASGDSSWRLLQNCANPSGPQDQGLQLAQVLTERFLAGRGAWRVHGGGFAGTIQVYVPQERVDDYRQFMDRFFGPESVQTLQIRQPGLTALAAVGSEQNPI